MDWLVWCAARRAALVLDSRLLCVQTEIIESFAGNLQRIDKDVRRCDRHVAFFSEQRNLDKLRNVVCTCVPLPLMLR